MKTAVTIVASFASLVCMAAPAQELVASATAPPAPTAAVASTTQEVRAHASAPASTAYHNDALQFVYEYPAPLQQQVVGSFQEAVQLGHREHFTAEALDPERAQTDRCMHVLFYAQTPPVSGRVEASKAVHGARQRVEVPAKGTVAVSEFDQSCVPEGSDRNEVLASLAAMPGELAGFQPIDQQMWYELDKHKVHFLSAQGTFPGDGASRKPMIVAVASVEVHDHLLFWMFMADSMPLLNQLLNSPVQFDQHSAAPLFPLSIGNGPPVRPIP